MKKFIVDYFKNFKNKTIKAKVCNILLVILYIAIVLVCVIPIECESTSPGSITKVGSVISLNTEEETNSKIYTCSVSVATSVSCLQYLLSKLDKNIDIEVYNHENDVFTINEDIKQNVCAKNQSIQDAIITAYTYAKNNGYDVNLSYTYKGVCVLAIPSNYYNAGPETLQIGDIVTKIDDTEIEDITTFRTIIEEKYLEYKAYIDALNASVTDSSIVIPEYPVCPVFTVIRNGEEVVLDSCMLMVVVNLGWYSSEYRSLFGEKKYESLFYNYYDINGEESNPKITINTANTIGPSGGLMQTIYVYNTITNGSIGEDKVLIGTGTISTDGSVGVIGGIKQKMVTAEIYSPTFFFVPRSNYADAINQYEKIKNPSITKDQIISVNTFDDVLEALLGE